MPRLLGGALFLCSCLLYFAKGDNTTCGNIYTEKNSTGEVRYHSGKSDSVEAGVTCFWIFVFNDSKSTNEVLLVLDEFHLEVSDSLTIERNGNGPSLNVGPFSGVMEPFMVLTGASNVTVTLKTSADKTTRKFQMHYVIQPSCNFNLTSVVTGTLLSPFYNTNRTNTVNCSVTIAVKSKESFKLSSVLVPLKVIDDHIGVEIKETDKLDGSYNGTQLPLEFTSKDSLKANVIIRPGSTSLQQIRFLYQAVTKECSDTVELAYSIVNSVTVSSPKETEASVGDTPSLNCRTLIFTRESVAGLSATVGTRNLTDASDQLLVQNETGGSLVHLTGSNHLKWQDQYILTNGKKVSVSLMSTFPSPLLNVSVTIALSRYGGYFEGSGQLTVSGQKENDPAVFLLRVDPSKQVMVNLTGRSPPKKGTVEFYSDFGKDTKPFARLGKDSTAFSFISPSHLMMVQAKGFDSETFDANFLPEDRGCFATDSGSSGSYILFGKCVDICAWTVGAQRNETAVDVDERKLHFSSLHLHRGDSLLVVQDNKKVVNVTGPLRHLNDYLFPLGVALDVIVQRKCSLNKTTITVVADYSPSPKCAHNFSMTAGQSVLLSSPGYPEGYPVGSNCKWYFHVPENSILHLEFLTLHLGSKDHRLDLYSFNGTVDEKMFANFTGDNVTLPRDYVVKNANLTIYFDAPTFNSSGALDRFQINITAADCGGEMLANDSGSFETPAGKKPGTTDAKLCIWLVGLEAKKKSIIQYNATSGGTSVLGRLEVHEGCSVRDAVSVNLTGIGLLSRTDHLLFVYRNADPGPSLSVRYSAYGCNESDTCGNGVCMHAKWKCNGLNDCGDWSDEKFCLGPSPPGPTPPTPEPSKQVNGVSSTALALGILAALLIGTLLGFGAPAAYRRIRTGQFGGSYSSFSNTADA